MYPTLFSIPIPFTNNSIPVHSYGFMMAVGFFFAIWVARYKAKREGLDPNAISDLGIYVLCSGIVGARLFYVILNLDQYKGNLIDVFKVYEGGLVFYGGLIAACGTFLVFAKIKKLPFFKIIDIISVSLVLGLAFGRIGCFLNGCCFGDPVDSGLFCAVRFPRALDDAGIVNGSPVFLHHYEQGLVGLMERASLPVHPTQIYAFLSCIIIFFILNLFWKYRKKDGEIFLLFCIIYSVYRFLIEFIRDDNPALFDSLTISQNVSMVVFLISLFFFVRFRRCRENS